jgi:hypothetical protein
MTDKTHKPTADDQEREADTQPREKSDRETFFSNQEQISRPDDQGNGEKARKPRSSNPDSSS